MSDTGYWKDAKGRRWHVVQKKDGSVVCNSNDTMTAAYYETWQIWKRSHGWHKDEPTPSKANLND